MTTKSYKTLALIGAALFVALLIHDLLSAKEFAVARLVGNSCGVAMMMYFYFKGRPTKM